MGTLSKLKQKLITACRILDKEGIIDELGHFSVRCPEKGGVFINGKVSPGQACEEDIVLLDMDGKKLEGDLEPAAESPLHLAVYQRRPDVTAIAHTHSPMVVTLSIAGRSIANRRESRCVCHRHQGACLQEIWPRGQLWNWGMKSQMLWGVEISAC